MRTMMLRITRSWNFRLLALLPAVLLFTAAAQAQGPTSVFQLDGKPDNSNLSCTYGTPCDYWNLLNGNGVGNPPGAAGHSLVRTFVNGSASTDSFTGGGSKDPNDISSWACSSTPTPNKDTLLAGYAAAYNSSGDFDLIFGADRLSPNGDANIGIWFFQQQITANCSSTGSFTGVHTDGDIFAISAFVGGGGTSLISVYKWDHTCTKGVKNFTVGQCADANLRAIALPTLSQECSDAAATTCAVTNSATVSPTYEANPLPTPTFFEGGLDITALLGPGLPCFSSILEETRSSQSTSAVLKDFVLGQFNICGMNLTKVCGTPGVSEDGSTINYPVSGVVTNTGIGSLYDVAVCDTINGSSSSTRVSVVNNTAGSGNNGTHVLGPGETGTWSDSSSTTAASQGDSAVAVATASSSGSSACGASPGPIVTGTPATANCTLSVSGTLGVTKSCSTSLVVGSSNVYVQVAYNGMVCNNSSSQVTGVGLTEHDNSAAGSSSVSPSATTLGPCESGIDANGNCTTECVGLWDETENPGNPGQDYGCIAPPGTCPAGHSCIPGNCATYSGNYAPTSDTPVSGGTGPGRYTFSDTVAVTSATPTVGTLSTITGNPNASCNGSYGCGSATCPICDAGECIQPPGL